MISRGDDDARKYLWTSEIPDVPVVDHYFKNEELVLLQYGMLLPKNLLAAHLEIDRTRVAMLTDLCFFAINKSLGIHCEHPALMSFMLIQSCTRLPRKDGRGAAIWRTELQKPKSESLEFTPLIASHSCRLTARPWKTYPVPQ